MNLGHGPAAAAGVPVRRSHPESVGRARGPPGRGADASSAAEIRAEGLGEPRAVRVVFMLIRTGLQSCVNLLFIVDFIYFIIQVGREDRGRPEGAGEGDHRRPGRHARRHPHGAAPAPFAIRDRS